MKKQTSNRVAGLLEDLEAVEAEYGSKSKEVEYQIGRTLNWFEDYDNLKQVMSAALRHAPCDHSTKTVEGAEERKRKYIASIPSRIQEIQS